ncbi:MAG: hypothetical protein M1816_004386 [Peltula sp. TS41687]|nr:MAG: hypothetical protein M1816_004386 [Peltula sp. TS41687]
MDQRRREHTDPEAPADPPLRRRPVAYHPALANEYDWLTAPSPVRAVPDPPMRTVEEETRRDPVTNASPTREFLGRFSENINTAETTNPNEAVEYPEAKMRKSTDLTPAQRAITNPFQRAGLVDPLRSHPPLDTAPQDLTRHEFGPRSSSLVSEETGQSEPGSAPGEAMQSGSSPHEHDLELTRATLAESESVSASQEPSGMLSTSAQQEMASGTALYPPAHGSSSADNGTEVEHHVNADAESKIGVKFQMKQKASIASFSTFGLPEVNLGPDTIVEADEEPQTETDHEHVMMTPEEPSEAGSGTAMEANAPEENREAQSSQVISGESATEREETFPQKLIIRTHVYPSEPTEDSGLRKPSPDGLEKYVKELLEKDESTGGRMLQAVRYVSVRGPWYPSDHFMMSDADIPPSQAPKVKRGLGGRAAQKDGEGTSQNVHQAHDEKVPDPVGDAPQEVKHMDINARIKREGMRGIMMVCQILSKTINIEGFDWTSDMPFEKEIWAHLPCQTITSLMIDVFRPGVRGDHFGGDVMPVADLHPLTGFKKLRTLYLRGMVASYQEVIWESVWQMPDLKFLDLKVMVEPGVRGAHNIHWPFIEGDWKVKDVEELSTEARGTQGSEGRDFYEGFGEYLDYVKMVVARNKVLPGNPDAKLGIVELELGGFAVDSKPFEHCFDMTKLEEMKFSENCLDAGFALPKNRRPDLKVTVPPGHKHIDTATTAVRYSLKKDLKLVTLKGGKVVKREPAFPGEK